MSWHRDNIRSVFRYARPTRRLAAAGALGIVVAASGCANKRGEKEVGKYDYGAECAKMCQRMGQCVPELAGKNKASVEGTAKAESLMKNAAANAKAGVAQCRAKLCPVAAARKADTVNAEAKKIHVCLYGPDPKSTELASCGKFLSCMGGLRKPKPCEAKNVGEACTTKDGKKGTCSGKPSALQCQAKTGA